MKWAESIHLLSKYHLLLDNSQEIILIYNSKGRIIDSSTKAKTELGYAEDIFQIYISDVFKDVFIYEDNQIKTNTKFQKNPKETIAYRKNQTCFPVELVIADVTKDNKKIGICNAVNLSERKEADRQINKLRSSMNDNDQISCELVAKIAHELKTPLNGIIGFAGNLMDMDLNTNQLEAVNLIKRCSGNLNSLINDLMDFERISKNKLLIKHKGFRFRDFMQDIVDFNIGNINNKGLKLQVYVSNDIPDNLLGDELRLTQILNNLLSNAVKFTPAGQIGLEVIKVLQTNRYVELLFMIIDTGIGIDIQEKDKLFKNFSQIDNSITRKYGGTGLGLSICKLLVEAMEGTITVDSEKDKGSTFSFTVRLGIPQESVPLNNNTEDEEFKEDYDKNLETENRKGNDISEIDYVNRRLKNISAHEKGNSIDTIQNEAVDINDLLEKLTICIEMENWEKAEQIAGKFKAINQKNQYLNSNDILRLLFAIRREDHDSSLSALNEVKVFMNKEK